MEATSTQASSIGSTLLIIVALCLSACSTAVGPDDASDAEYAVRVAFKRLTVVGDCDDDPRVTDDDGEFAFRVRLTWENPDGTWRTPSPIYSTRRFGRGDGSVEKLSDDSEYEINKTRTLTIAEGLNYRMTLSVIEWDGREKDTRMSGQEVAEENRAGGRVLTYNHEIELGEEDACKVKLYVDVEESLK